MSIHKSDAIPVMNQIGSDVVSCNNAVMFRDFHLDLDINVPRIFLFLYIYYIRK